MPSASATDAKPSFHADLMLAIRRTLYGYVGVCITAFGGEVRRMILDERPRVVAVELPVTLEQAYLHSVSRLPAMEADENFIGKKSGNIL